MSAKSEKKPNSRSIYALVAYLLLVVVVSVVLISVLSYAAPYIIAAAFAAGIVGLIAYAGFNYFQTDKRKTSKKTIRVAVVDPEEEYLSTKVTNSLVRDSRLIAQANSRSNKYQTGSQRLRTQQARAPQTKAPQRRTPDEQALEHFKAHIQSAYQEKRASAPTTYRKNICIIGMGPAGILSALRAYANGHSVTIIDKRNEYTRENVFRISAGLMRQLLREVFYNMHAAQDSTPGFDRSGYVNTKWMTIGMSLVPLLDELFDQEGVFYTISINKFEELLSICLEALAINDPENIKIYRGHDITDIDPEGGIISATNSTTTERVTVHTGCIVNATGANGSFGASKRPVASALFKEDSIFTPTTSKGQYLAATLTLQDLQSGENISRKLNGARNGKLLAAFEEGAAEHITQHPEKAELVRRRLAKFELRSGNFVRKPSTLFEQRVVLGLSTREEYFSTRSAANREDTTRDELEIDLNCATLGIQKYIALLNRDFAWSRKDRLPLIRQLNSNTSFYIGMEISKQLFADLTSDLPDEQKIERLNIWIAHNLAQFYPREVIKQVQINRYEAFELQVQSSNQIIAQSSSGVQVFNIGDSLVTPHFLTGTGVESAYNCIGEWIEYLDDNDQKKYVSQIQKRQKEVSAKVTEGLKSVELVSVEPNDHATRRVPSRAASAS